MSVHVPERGDPSWAGLPAWATTFRDVQVQAVAEVLEAFEAGAKVVMLDAPTGTGKTLIAEMVRAQLDEGGVRGVYVCSTKTLQDQFARDFDAAVLKGRANYPTEHGGGKVTADDCTGNACVWCTGVDTCPYQVARGRFDGAGIGCTNTAYLLGQVNNTRPDKAITAKRGLVTIDECDELEGVLVGQAGLNVGSRQLDAYGLRRLKKGAHGPTVVAWLEEGAGIVGGYAKQQLKARDVEGRRKAKRAMRLAAEMDYIAGDMDENPEEWIRDYSDRDAGRVILKPVRVGRYASEMLWRHADRWLCMSATILSPDQWAEDVGLEDEAWSYVTVPMGFHVDNRPIIVAPIADMGRKGAGTWEERITKMASGIARVLDTHGEGVNTLVHTVSYNLAADLLQELTGKPARGHEGAWQATMRTPEGRRINVHTYMGAAGRDEAVDAFKRDGGVIVASSLERGVDLIGDLCRVVIVAKVPYPNMGDRRTAARMRLAGGRSWYATHTARSIVQMTGRGVRSHDDWATTYIFDAQFQKFWGQWSKLLPRWWRDAVEVQNPRQLLGT